MVRFGLVVVVAVWLTSPTVMAAATPALGDAVSSPVQRNLGSKGKGGGKGGGKSKGKGGSKGKSKGKGNYGYYYPPYSYTDRQLGKGKGKGKAAGEQVVYYPEPEINNEVFECTVWGTTDAPIYPWCPESVPTTDSSHSHGEDIIYFHDDYYNNGGYGASHNHYGGYGYGTHNHNGGYGYGYGGYGTGGYGTGYGHGTGYGTGGRGGDDYYDDDDNGGRSGFADDDGGGSFRYDGVENMLVDFAIDLDGQLEPTMARIQHFLNDQVAGHMTSGDGTSTGGVTITHVDFFVSEDRDAASYCDTCVNLDVLAHVYYSGSGSTNLLAGAVLDAFLRYCNAFTNIQGVGSALNPCHTLGISTILPVGYKHDTSSGDDGTGVVVIGTGTGSGGGLGGAAGGLVESTTRSAEPTGIGAGGAVGIAAAGLFLLALLAFFASRRRRNRGKHQELEEGPDETFMLDGVRSRDEDSRFGMYPEGQSDGMVLGDRSWNQDVHKCSSATCKLCEKRRDGLQFLPTKGPTSAIVEDPLNL